MSIEKRIFDSPDSLTEQTAGALREMIIGGEFAPGHRLSEAQLAERLDVSRNTLREVFRLLTREGLLQHKPNRGVFVAVPSMASILDIYRIRRLIEIPALSGAWPRHEAVARMRQAVERAQTLAAAGDWRGVGSANMDFHGAIIALTDSPRLLIFFTQIAAELRLAFGLLDNPELLHQPFIARNRTIVDRLEQGHGTAAATLLQDYLMESERVVLAAFARRA
ncbi:GntR family transcriptional regulator [Paracoccus marinaquae]|uniref:GntR family transcriptional regulator n=1 Tax=Paracoccus marinaquae TaxID=2841926 RepID=A0ABS6AM80_9RHOB|nr:GntR family transcriptional regulator [Paracoccus marinaquae]MBU3030745.1 GntR family transcriptional regulator [Paracoccus marinaquae]